MLEYIKSSLDMSSITQIDGDVVKVETQVSLVGDVHRGRINAVLLRKRLEGSQGFVDGRISDRQLLTDRRAADTETRDLRNVILRKRIFFYDTSAPLSFRTQEDP